eukprot:PITA_13603
MKTKIAAWGGYWLTKGGKVILIKSVLSALPIFQAAFLLAPPNVMEQISRLLRDFLWQGGKGNENRIHLVNWDAVKRMKEEGGLQIRDPQLVNLALGGKILWKLIHDPTHPVSITLRSKYGVSKDLSNLERAGVKSLYELSKWNQRGEWEGWDVHGVPNRLKYQQSLLEDRLEDASPVHRASKDCWGWGQSGIYSTVAGYSTLQGLKNSNHPPTFWKNVWDSFATPKVNLFCWTLIHNKILTGDNLEKRNITGPHRCAMCNNKSETIRHLFMDCSVEKEVWGLILRDLLTPVPSFNSAVDLFASWRQHYPHHIPQKSLWTRIWATIPKYVCWQIWLARNQQIFKEVRHTPLQIAAKAKAFLMEAAQQ